MQSKKTILIVEDEDSILQALQRILELTGEYEAVAAQDGEKALLAMQNVIPDLIISDISMPNMNGLDFCKKVRENPVTKSIPFIFLTAKKEKLIEGISAGGDDFLMKPFNVDEVLIKIEAMFRRVNQSREQASQHKGQLEDMNVDAILALCLRERISGELVLQQDGEVGVVRLENGDIDSVLYGDFSADAGLDALREWKKGTFVIRPSDIKIKVDTHSKMTEMDLTKAHKIAENIWWVGYVNKVEGVFHNTYLRIFEHNEKKINAIIDPGSPLHFNDISTKIAEVLGDFAKANIFIPMSSDPDVCLNNLFFRKANSRIICMTGSEAWENIKHYEINPKSVKKIEIRKNPTIKLASGHQLHFIPTPFCGSNGSFMTFDVEHKVLFSGLIFSSEITSLPQNTIYATENDWEGLRRFHQRNIGSNKALENVINSLLALRPVPEIIVPRYGRIIKKDLIEFFIERLKQVSVGIDNYLEDKNDPEIMLYLEAANTLVGQIQGYVSIEKSLKKINEEPKLSASCGVEGKSITSISGDGETFYLRFIKTLMQDEEDTVANHIKTAALKIAYNLGINLPEF